MTNVARHPASAPYLAVAITVALTVYGQGVVKWRVNRAGDSPPQVADQLTWAAELFLDPWVWTAAVAVVLASMAWLSALSRLELSTAYPLMSTSLILVVLLGAFAFDEPLGFTKVAGAGLVVIGIIIANRGGPSDSPAGLRDERAA